MQFKPTSHLLLFAITLALQEPLAVAEPIIAAGFKEVEPVVTARNDPGSLIARACSYTTGCVSQSGASAGKYCGFCTQVRGTYVATHIYQVNGGSGSSSCCDYGESSSCSAHWPSVSPNVLVDCANTSNGY